MRTSIVVILALAIATAVGCIRVPTRTSPVRREFAVQVQPPSAKNETVHATLKVGTFRVASPFRNTELVYRTSDTAYQTDFYNTFLSPPGSLIGDQIRLWLGSSGLFAQTVPEFSRVAHTYFLEGEIVELYGDYRNPAKPLAVIRIQFFLLRNTQGGSEIVFEKTYSAATLIERRDAALLAEGFGRGLNEILPKLAADIAERIKALPS